MIKAVDLYATVSLSSARSAGTTTHPFELINWTNSGTLLPSAACACWISGGRTPGCSLLRRASSPLANFFVSGMLLIGSWAVRSEAPSLVKLDWNPASSGSRAVRSSAVPEAYVKSWGRVKRSTKARKMGDLVVSLEMR